MAELITSSMRSRWPAVAGARADRQYRMCGKTTGSIGVLVVVLGSTFFGFVSGSVCWTLEPQQLRVLIHQEQVFQLVDGDEPAKR